MFVLYYIMTLNHFYFLFLVMCTALIADCQICENVEHIELNTGYSGNPMMEQFPSYEDNEFIYFFSQRHKTNYTIREEFKIYRLNSQTLLIDSFSLVLEKKNQEILVNDMFFNGNLMFIASENKFYTFKRINAKYKCIKKVGINYNYNNILYADSKKMILGVAYNFHPHDQKERVLLSQYDVSGKLIKNQRLKFHGIEFSHLTNQWMDGYNENFLFAQTLTYQIDIYDKNIDSVTSITRPIFSNNENVTYWIDSKQAAMEMFSIDSSVSRIIESFFIDEKTIGVVYKEEGMNYHNEHKLDIWKEKKGIWSLIKDGIYINTKQYLISDTLKSTTIGQCPYLPQSGDNILLGGYIYEIRHFLSKNANDGKSKSVLDYEDENMDAQLKLDCGLFMTRIKLEDYVDLFE